MKLKYGLWFRLLSVYLAGGLMLVASPLGTVQNEREFRVKGKNSTLQEENIDVDSGNTPYSRLSVIQEISEAPVMSPEFVTNSSNSESEVAAEKAESRPARHHPVLVQDVDRLPPDEEARLGRLLHERILDDHPADPASPYPRIVFEAAKRLIERRKRKGGEITITVLDSDEVNAFSHLGGYIYLSRGLFNLASTEEDFQFIVGHELGHLNNRDGEQQVAEETRAGGLTKVGTLGALYHQIAHGYPEALEFSADNWVVDQMLILDQTRRECLSFLRKFVGLSERDGFQTGSEKPGSDPDAAWQDVENHYRSHPAAWKRLSRMESRFKRIPTPHSPDERK